MEVTLDLLIHCSQMEKKIIKHSLVYSAVFSTLMSVFNPFEVYLVL